MLQTKPITPVEQRRLFPVLQNYGFDIAKIKLQKNIVANVNNVFFIYAGQKKFVLRESEKQKTFQERFFLSAQINHWELCRL